MRKTGSFNRIMSSLCCRTVPGGYGSVRIRDFIVGKIMRCSVPISHTASSVPVAFKGKTCFITVDGEIRTADKEGRLSLAAKLPDVSYGLDLPGNLAVGSQWVIFTSEGSFVFDTESNMLRPSPPEWNIPGGEVSVDNRGIIGYTTRRASCIISGRGRVL